MILTIVVMVMMMMTGVQSPANTREGMSAHKRLDTVYSESCQLVFSVWLKHEGLWLHLFFFLKPSSLMGLNFWVHKHICRRVKKSDSSGGLNEGPV